MNIHYIYLMMKSEEEKLHIAIVGRHNVGKSKLINCIVNQKICVVDDAPGTTTDELQNKVELLPYGPVVIVDTAGINSEEDFAKKIINKTIRAISLADFAIVVLDARSELTKSETELITLLRKIEVPFLVAVNKIEFGINQNLLTELEALEVTHFEISCKENAGIEYFKKKLIHLLPDIKKNSLLKDFVCKGDLVVFVIPDDYEMLDGGITKLYIKSIKDCLNKEIKDVIVKENDLLTRLKKLKKIPDLIITNSACAERIASKINEKIKLTTYSCIMTQKKGILTDFILGAKKSNELKNGDKILFSETCNSHLQRFELGKTKLIYLLKSRIDKELNIDYSNGSGFPDSISDYKLIVHCDGCQVSTKSLQSKVKQAKLLDIPITDYSTLISFINNTYQRTYIPFCNQMMPTTD